MEGVLAESTWKFFFGYDHVSSLVFVRLLITQITNNIT